MEYKVLFTTNIDHYPNNCWPTKIKIPPRIGDQVQVVDSFLEFYRSRKLPTSLKVVNVTWSEHAVICELWYKQNDVAAAKLSGVELL